MADKSSFIYAFVAGPIVIGAAYGVSSLLLSQKSITETDGANLLLTYDLLLWAGTPIALVALLPLVGGLLKIVKKR